MVDSGRIRRIADRWQHILFALRASCHSSGAKKLAMKSLNKHSAIFVYSTVLSLSLSINNHRRRLRQISAVSIRRNAVIVSLATTHWFASNVGALHVLCVYIFIAKFSPIEYTFRWAFANERNGYFELVYIIIIQCFFSRLHPGRRMLSFEM